ncbi:MAG TPA: GNAT family N-acetyltransferase [Chitinophaga sp.]|uniref:GNAT family N-acetyltransferase n=1 Tax=Chitinophaga sp. TaxID=1869181 RepID=UPI002C0F35C7|nr:GNAT family N-acetyltransferase [Chitinophaga sp.]HVI46559.1 GNAT family N-acetyltransferase [Chitinophaga sp.]
MIYLNDFHDLQDQTTEDICTAFNEAFSDYLVPLQLTPSILEQKMKGENLQRAYSIGAFDGDTIGAFILHGTDNSEHPKELYNGGTGVRPAHRGQHLVQKMYDKFIPVYRRQGIEKITLEVISTNLPAIKAYTNSGFRKSRIFHCYKGTITAGEIPAEIIIKENDAPDWQQLAAFMDMKPGWSNTPESILREQPYTGIWEAFIDGQPAGYIAVHRDTRRIRNIAVHPDFRRRGVGNALLRHAADTLGDTMSIINIDENSPEIGKFLEQAGLKFYLSQYEMTIAL